MIDTYNIDNAIFIDDSIEHLEKCKHIKTLELYQANWGYISKEASIALSNEMIFNKIKELIG